MTPDDDSLPQDNSDRKMAVGEHLRELRKSLFPVLLCWFVGTFAAFPFLEGEWYVRTLTAPLYALLVTYPLLCICCFHFAWPGLRGKEGLLLALIAGALPLIVGALALVMYPIEWLWMIVGYPKLATDPVLVISKALICSLLLGAWALCHRIFKDAVSRPWKRLWFFLIGLTCLALPATIWAAVLVSIVLWLVVVSLNIGGVGSRLLRAVETAEVAAEFVQQEPASRFWFSPGANQASAEVENDIDDMREKRWELPALPQDSAAETQVGELRTRRLEWRQLGAGPFLTTGAFRSPSPGGVSFNLTRRPTPSIPTNVDRVHFSVSSPPAMTPGACYVIDVWAYLEDQRERMIQRAREEAAGADLRMKSKGPISVARGSVLTVRLRLQDLLVNPLIDTILWESEIGNALFAVTVPQSAAIGPRQGSATIYFDGLEIARVSFVVEVGQESSPCDSRPVPENRHRTAFASYAHDDRDAVLARIQGIQKGAPDLDIFLDVARLRSGEHWQERLKNEIVSRDVFYLFWSEAASRSKWVEWEWRCALQERGIDFIDPCPLVSPDQVPPPTELSGKLHFSDWTLAYMSSRMSELALAKSP